MSLVFQLVLTIFARSSLWALFIHHHSNGFKPRAHSKTMSCVLYWVLDRIYFSILIRFGLTAPSSHLLPLGILSSGTSC